MTILNKLSKELEDCIISLAQTELLLYSNTFRSFQLTEDNKQLNNLKTALKPANMYTAGIASKEDKLDPVGIKGLVDRNDLLIKDYQDRSFEQSKICLNLDRNIKQLRIDIKNYIKGGMKNPKIIEKPKCFKVNVYGLKDLYEMIRKIVLN